MFSSWAFALVALLGCGGGSSGGGTPSAAQVKDACTKVCQKESTCNGLTLDCNSVCASNGSGGSGNMAIPAGCNTNDTLNKVQACVNGTCDALLGCLDSATSACEGTTGGTTGTGGSASKGGTSSSSGGAASGDCSTCTKANACCVALAAQTGSDASQCASITTAACTSAGAQQSVYISSCQTILTSAASLNIAACK